MFPFMEPKPVLMPCYYLALAHPGVNSTSTARTCRCWVFHFKGQTVLVFKRLFSQWESRLTFLFLSFDHI